MTTPINWSGDEDRRNSLLFDQATYEQLTGQKVELGENEILAYGYQYPGRLDAQLEINGKTFTIKQKLDSNFIQGKLPKTPCFNTKWACT